MDNIVIIGSSGHAKVIIDIVQQEGRYNIAGLLDDGRNVGEQTLGYSVLGPVEDLPELVTAHAIKGVIVAIGDNFVRSQVAGRIQDVCPDLPFVSAIHPSASIATEVSIGEGTVVMAGVSINPCSSIGRSCILNTHSSLDHDSVLEDFASLAPHATTGGNCHIGQYSAISIGAVLVHGIHIGEQTVIGAGSVVMTSIQPFVVAYGTPAKIIRSRKPGDQYL
ncbi:acetyltransferase [Acaryochloris sp. IP29b_bin.148]|uniref:acetyltransferase n=1 Tax=Acaryochloris sp. IP29b_bin.148 TaxID=2969218 RepID=UPI00261B4E27|nr:acetyltransferase [Acaryochloris sp. IP29b_bin.148]